jgi:hypothetical protein
MPLKRFNYLSETMKSNPLKFDPAAKVIKDPTGVAKMPGNLTSGKKGIAPLTAPNPGPVTPPLSHMQAVAPPPMTNENSVPALNHIPSNLSRVTKNQKIDKFPRLYRVLRS